MRALIRFSCAAFYVWPLAASPSEVVAPTYNAEIAPILNRSCVRCHRDEGIAPSLTLTTYERAKRIGADLKRTVRARQMPPWPADAARSVPFTNDPRLPQKDIDTLSAWVDAGMPRGEGVAPPVQVPVPAKWDHPESLPPDVVIALPEVSVPANGEIPYVIQRVKVPFAADRWIDAMQVRPGIPALVHHMGITEIVLDNGMSEEDADAFGKLARQLGAPPDALDATRPAVGDPSNAHAYDMLGVYTPGSTFETYAKNSGKLIKAGERDYINFNIHYTTIGVQASDRSQLALWFARTAPAHQLIRSPAAVETLIVNGRQLLIDDPGTPAEGTAVPIPPIPPEASNYEIIGMTAYTEPTTLYQLQPHAHMRGKDFLYTVVYPDGHELTLLSIPHYDFHWQLAYDLKAPLRLPAGSKLVVTAHYDNSRDNPHLQNLGTGELAKNCGPEKAAYFRRQNQSWHEMFSPLVQYSVDVSRSHPRRAKLVEVTGCLEISSARWFLEDAGTPSPTAAQSTSAAEAAAHAKHPLGTARYELVGSRFFGPERFDKRKVIVKGVVSGAASTLRLNLTSLQTAGACPAE